MKHIFNKNNSGIEEMQVYFSHISGMNDFPDIESDVLLAEEELYKYVGKKVIDRGIKHYHSVDFRKDADASGSGEDVVDELNDSLVEHIQMAVCLLAYREFALNNDATHTKTGRAARMDKDSDQLDLKLIDRDDLALMRKGQKAIDRLIKFVDENRLPEWVNSDVYKKTRDLIIWNADLFDSFHPIEKSFRLYSFLVPMIRKIQDTVILPVLGTARMKALLEYIQQYNEDASGSGSDDESMTELVKKASYPIAYYAMASAYREIPVLMFPENMSRQFWSAGNGLAFVGMKDKMVESLNKEGNSLLQGLISYIEAAEAEAAGTPITDDAITTITERMLLTDKFVRV